MVCNMSPAFLAANGDGFPSANVTVDGFHVVQFSTTAVDEVQEAAANERKLPKAHPLGRAQGRCRRQDNRKAAAGPDRIGTRRLRHRLAAKGDAALNQKGHLCLGQPSGASSPPDPKPLDLQPFQR
ncbi:hypothetical protein DFAR_2310012 [Desulfarculales bacterium]